MHLLETTFSALMRRDARGCSPADKHSGEPDVQGERDVTTVTAPALDASTFRDLMARIRPRPEEVRWQSIPWQTDVWEARRLAAEQGKPIFLWAMNGNPLGCT
jgi:hypothetical protein